MRKLSKVRKPKHKGYSFEAVEQLKKEYVDLVFPAEMQDDIATRKHESVFLRYAFINAFKTYCHQNVLAQTWDMARTTMYHVFDKHEDNLKTHPLYRVCYQTALSLKEKHDSQNADDIS